MSDELEGSSVKDRIMKLCLEDKETSYKEQERNESMTFVTQTYQKCISNIKNAQSRLKSAQSNAKTFAKESAVMDLEATMRTYFNEEDKQIVYAHENPISSKTEKPNSPTQNGGKVPEDRGDNTEVSKDQENNGNIKRSNAARLYFAINTGVIVAVMNTYNKAMKKHLKFVKTLAKLGGVVDIPSDNAADKNQQQNTNNNQ